jgi:hypothetical protein
VTTEHEPTSLLDEEGVPTAAPVPSAEMVTAEPVVPVEPVKPVGGVEPEAPRKRRGLLVLCAVLFAGTLGFGALAAASTAKLNSERHDRAQVQDVSGRFAAALLTYDYNDLDGAKRRVLALSTGKFRKEYEQAFSGGLDVLFKETKATSAGTVTDVFVGLVENGTVTTIAVVDAVARGTAGNRRLVSSYIQLQLVKVGGQWQVDGVTNLNLAAAGDSTGTTPAPATATTTPTTTAPTTAPTTTPK